MTIEALVARVVEGGAHTERGETWKCRQGVPSVRQMPGENG